MAYTYAQNQSVRNFTNFFNFLDEHKNGTFLENATLTLKTTYSSYPNDTITITLNNSELNLIVDNIQSSNVVLQYKGKYSTFSVSSVSKSSNNDDAFNRLRGALLSENGMLFQYRGYSNQSTTLTKFPIAITVDSNGELAVIAHSGYLIAVETYSNYLVLSYNSINNPTSYGYPNYSSVQTSFSQIVPHVDDPAITLPYAFVATHSQVAGEGFSEIEMNGEKYITNGFWYIKE